MSVNIIKNVITKNKDAFSDDSSLALINYFNSTTEEYISFDKLYGSYVKKEVYLKKLDFLSLKNTSKDVTLKGLKLNLKANSECAWWCPLGCGSDWGCCGNYEGCCLYTDPLCLIHDALCTNCEPIEFCFSGCVPD